MMNDPHDSINELESSYLNDEWSVINDETLNNGPLPIYSSTIKGSNCSIEDSESDAKVCLTKQKDSTSESESHRSPADVNRRDSTETSSSSIIVLSQDQSIESSFRIDDLFENSKKKLKKRKERSTTIVCSRKKASEESTTSVIESSENETNTESFKFFSTDSCVCGKNDSQSSSQNPTMEDSNIKSISPNHRVDQSETSTRKKLKIRRRKSRVRDERLPQRYLFENFANSTFNSSPNNTFYRVKMDEISADQFDRTIFLNEESIHSVPILSLEKSHFSNDDEPPYSSSKDSFSIHTFSVVENDFEFLDDDNKDNQDLETFSLQRNYSSRSERADEWNRKTYVHQPNTALNRKLNCALILTVCVVVGLGIGNFIGLSNRYDHRERLSLSQIMKLKQLQNDWLICTKDEKIVLVDDENKLIYLDGFSKLCGYANSYQTRRFLFFDGKNDLTKFFEEIYQSIHDETANNFNNSLMTNIYDLEEDFLETDKRSSQTLSQISEAVNMRAKRYRKRVQALEEENQSLKKRLEDEEIDDEVLEQHYQSKLLRLEEENQQLKSLIKFEDEQDLEKTKKLESKIDELVQNNHRLQQFLDFLERQIIMGQEIENSLDYSRKIYDSRNRHKLDSLMMDDSREKNQYNLIRQKINQLMHENEELKSKIALYRWTDSGKFSQNTDGTQSEEKKLKQMKIRLKIMEKKLSTFNENNEKLKQINRQLNDSNNKLKDKLYEANLHQIKNSLDKEPFIEKENFISKATHSNKKNEHKENLKSAASISERIKETYQWLSKQFTLNNGDWTKAEMPKIFELGSELVKSTTNKMQVLTEILSEGKLSSVNKQSDYLVDYLTDNINKFSNIIDKSLRSVLNEMKENLQYINQNKDSLEKNRMEQDQLRHLDDLHMNMDSDSLREEHSMIKKKQSRKRFRKITDKEMLKIKSNSNWLINRSKLREDARLSKLSAMQATAKNSNAWLMRRAKAREKYRNEQSDKK